MTFKIRFEVKKSHVN